MDKIDELIKGFLDEDSDESLQTVLDAMQDQGLIEEGEDDLEVALKYMLHAGIAAVSPDGIYTLLGEEVN